MQGCVEQPSTAGWSGDTDENATLVPETTVVLVLVLERALLYRAPSKPFMTVALPCRLSSHPTALQASRWWSGLQGSLVLACATIGDLMLQGLSDHFPVPAAPAPCLPGPSSPTASWRRGEEWALSLGAPTGATQLGLKGLSNDSNAMAVPESCGPAQPV